MACALWDPVWEKLPYWLVCKQLLRQSRGSKQDKAHEQEQGLRGSWAAAPILWAPRPICPHSSLPASGLHLTPSPSSLVTPNLPKIIALHPLLRWTPRDQRPQHTAQGAGHVWHFVLLGSRECLCSACPSCWPVSRGRSVTDHIPGRLAAGSEVGRAQSCTWGRPCARPTAQTRPPSRAQCAR